MPGLFVTATGTDVGKTYVTAGLIRAGRRAGLAMEALKPMLTGFGEGELAASDAGILLQALGHSVTAETIATIAPFRFAAPLAPSMAAASEGGKLDFEAVVTACRAAVRPDRLTLVEGIGGIMVPLDDSRTVLDLIEALSLPVLLVAETALGALSHCLTAAAALRSRGITPALVVLNESAHSTVPLGATRDTLSRFLQPTPIAIVERNADAPCFDALLDQIGGIEPIGRLP